MRERAHPSASLFDDTDFEPPAAVQSSSPVQAAPVDEDLARLGRRLSTSIMLGTSSWSFPGWQGIVFDGNYSETQLARSGLAAYAQHPLLRTVSIDRSFYQPLAAADFAGYAQQVPAAFRFVIKAPAQVTDAVVRTERGAPTTPNPHFLDARAADECFVRPAFEGLGEHTGPLIFQLPPLPREMLAGAAAQELIERLGDFLGKLPRTVGDTTPIYALELRNAELLTPRLVRALGAAGARLVVGIHPRMPVAARQAAALRALDAADDEGDAWTLKGPLIVRWNLAAGQSYEDAKHRLAPFNRLVEPDLVTRGALAHLAHVALRSGQPAFIIANNKAEGCAPLSLIELAKAIVS